MAASRVYSFEQMRDADDDSRRSVARLYADVRPRLYRYALMILANAADAEDVVQQVFAGALAQSSGSVEQPLAYFRTAVRNAAYSVLRARRTARAAEHQMLEPVAEGCSPAERAALEQALRALPAEQREVVHLHVYEGMTFQEIADDIDESINTVAARYRYALDKMRRMLR